MRPFARWPLRFLRRLVIVLVVLMIAAGPSAAADDAIVLRVRGKSQLKLRQVSRRPDGKNAFTVQFSLELSDGVSGDKSDSGDDRSFADRPILAQLRGPAGTLYLPTKRTGDDGLVTFEQSAVEPATYSLLAEYRGDDLRDSVREVFTIDVGRQPTQLRLMAPARIRLSDELPLRIALTSDGAPLDGTVELSIGRKQETVTLSQGYGQHKLRAQALGKSGDKLSIVARYKGTRQFAPSETKEELLLVSQATVQLQLIGATHEIPQGNALTALGLVRDEQGPLAGEVVELEALTDETIPALDPASSKRSIGQAQTDSQGRFDIRIAKLLLPTGPVLLSAQVFPRRGHILPGRSPEVALQVLPPEPISVLYFVLPLAVTLLLWVGFVLGRRVVAWLRATWAARRLQQQSSTSKSTEAAAITHSTLDLSTGEPGVKLSPNRRLASLRRAADFAMDGQVVDATFGIPVAATLSMVLDGLSQAEPGRTLTTEADGSFATPPLPQGRYQMRISAPGYLPQQFSATVPHKGEYRQIAVRLEPLRVRLLAEWRRVAEGLGDDKVATQTPRELHDLLTFAKSRRLSEPIQQKLGELTQLVENAYYSPRICTPEMLVSAAQLVDAILASETAASKSPAPDLRAPSAPRPLINQPRA
ncbi:MAG TPA: carboxypeptidase-like regulatory domain-containing protein [Pseudomonadota bacterium]|nr:carboxypeptidase-like regulatory domain-containing protein [Pseudomonadota bacterium]